MKNNLIIKFDIDINVKILLNNNVIGESGYKDTFKTTLEEDGLLTIKHGTKKANIRVSKDQINNISVTYSTSGQLKATFVSNTSAVKNETNKEETIVEENNTVDKNVTNEMPNQNVGVIVTVIICIICVGYFVLPNLFSSSSGCDSGQCYMAEQVALQDIPELGHTWYTVKSNELNCNANSITDDEIVLVKCTTTNEELLDYYGSSTIWYGYLESADGYSYFRWADANQSTVLSKLRQ